MKNNNTETIKTRIRTPHTIISPLYSSLLTCSGVAQSMGWEDKSGEGPWTVPVRTVARALGDPIEVEVEVSVIYSKIIVPQKFLDLVSFAGRKEIL